jgi:hypothetical protein
MPDSMTETPRLHSYQEVIDELMIARRSMLIVATSVTGQWPADMVREIDVNIADTREK